MIIIKRAAASESEAEEDCLQQIKAFFEAFFFVRFKVQTTVLHLFSLMMKRIVSSGIVERWKLNL